MIQVRSCPICGRKDLAARRAKLAPFIWERCYAPSGPSARMPATLHRFIAKVRTRLHMLLEMPALALQHCPDCDFAFFSHRYDDLEVARIYQGYRDDRYNQDRIRLEPDYLAVSQAMDGRGTRYHGTRIAALAKLASKWGLHPGTVLDYGGEADAWLARGVFPEAEVRAFDLSDGSEKPTDLTFELVLCAHVLEHVAHPSAFLEELAGHVAPGGALYLELPLEYGVEVAELLRAPSRTPVLHEHLSFFTPRAVERLLTPLGFRVEHNDPIRSDYYAGMGVLARKA